MTRVYVELAGLVLIKMQLIQICIEMYQGVLHFFMLVLVRLYNMISVRSFVKADADCATSALFLSPYD